MEPAAQAIIRIAAQKFEEGSSYIHLAELGNQLRASGVALPPGMKLRDVIEQHCQESLQLQQHPDLRLVWVAVPANRDEPVKWPTPPSRHLPDEHAFLEEVHHNFLVAFCKNINIGQKIFVRPRAPIRYHVSDGEPPFGFIEVPATLRLPGVIVGNIRTMDDNERDVLASNVRRFMEQHGIALRSVVKRSTQQPSPGVDDCHSALERLVMAQPEALRRQLVLPADIAVLLSRN